MLRCERQFHLRRVPEYQSSPTEHHPMRTTWPRGSWMHRYFDGHALEYEVERALQIIKPLGMRDEHISVDLFIEQQIVGAAHVSATIMKRTFDIDFFVVQPECTERGSRVRWTAAKGQHFAAGCHTVECRFP